MRTAPRRRGTALARLAPRVRTAIALLALFVMATGQVGSCGPERDRPVGTIDPQSMPKGLRAGGRLTSNVYWRGNGVATHVIVSPSPAHVGEALRYLAVIRANRNQRVQFEPPQSGGEFTWSNVRAGRQHPAWWKQSAYDAVDSVWIEARLQVFTTGLVSIPGPRAKLESAPGAPGPGVIQLPTAQVMITPTVTAADSNQSLRGLHGPLGAPWWERVPVLWLLAALALVVAWVVVLQKLRQRKRKPVRRPSTPLAPPARPRIDPAAEALRALFTLRAKKLPAQQRFGEHALELTAILRRFLEATVATPRPGDTSGELLERLRASRHEKADLERLEGLLGLWDRVKFARAPLTEEEATRCEEAVEGYVRRVAQARLEAEAAAARAAAARAAATAGRGSGGPPPPAAGPPSGARPRPSSGSMARPASSATPRPASSATSRPASSVTQRPSSASGPKPPTRPGGRPPAPEAA